MRTEQEVINRVLSYAESVPDIQAVIRTNLVPVRKYLYSYEFYFIVKNIGDFEADETFEQCFGERILLYRGDRNYPDMLDGMKAHLMVYKDQDSRDVRNFLRRVKCKALCSLYHLYSGRRCTSSPRQYRCSHSISAGRGFHLLFPKYLCSTMRFHCREKRSSRLYPRIIRRS